MEGDQVVFENSIKSNEEHILFEDKKYTFIVDTTSNSGVFASNQIIFNLKTLSSQSDWTSLAEAVVEFPIKITAQVSQANNASGGTFTSSTWAGINAAIQKAGFHHWFNSSQLIIKGQTVQSMQQLENVAATYRILSSWSQDNLKKWGKSTGVILDDCTDNTGSSNLPVDKFGMSNTPYTTICTAARGLDVVNNQDYLNNLGVNGRAKLNNTSADSGNLATYILGVNGMVAAGMSNVATFATSTTATPVSQYIFVQYMMGTVRVKDLFDIDEFPLCKNLDGYLYLNINSATTTLTATVAAGVQTNILASSSTQITAGQTCPYLLNVSKANNQTNAPYGINFDVGGTGATLPTVVTVVGAVDGTKTATSGMSNSLAGPLLTQARLVCPYYHASPRIDAALTRSDHKFSTLEKLVIPITIPAAGSTNQVLTVGVPNPRKLVILPMWQTLGGSTITNPAQSPFDSSPATSGPYAYINQLQVYLANKPLFQTPINYDFEMWNDQISQNGANGNQMDEMTSGLLNQQLWSQNHRFYTIDLQRRTQAEDGSSKAVQVQWTNPSPTLPMLAQCIIFYERKWSMNTELCNLSSYA